MSLDRHVGVVHTLHLWSIPMMHCVQTFLNLSIEEGEGSVRHLWQDYCSYFACLLWEFHVVSWKTWLDRNLGKQKIFVKFFFFSENLHCIMLYVLMRLHKGISYFIYPCSFQDLPLNLRKFFNFVWDWKPFVPWSKELSYLFPSGMKTLSSCHTVTYYMDLLY